MSWIPLFCHFLIAFVLWELVRVDVSFMGERLWDLLRSRSGCTSFCLVIKVGCTRVIVRYSFSKERFLLWLLGFSVASCLLHLALGGLFLFRALQLFFIDDYFPYTCSCPAEKISLDQCVSAG